MKTSKRSPMADFVRCTLVLSCLSAPTLFAQERAAIPLAGEYRVVGKQIKPMVYPGQVLPGVGKVETFIMRAQVNECGDKIEILDPDVTKFTFEYKNGKYYGNGKWDDKRNKGKVTGDLRALTAIAMVGEWMITDKEGGMVPWEVSLNHLGVRGALPPKSASVRTEELETFIEQRQGLYVTETTRFRLILSRFKAKDSTLLEQHTEALRAVAKDPPKPEPGPNELCQSVKSNFLYVEGFADNGIEKDYPRAKLALERAKVTAGYIARSEYGMHQGAYLAGNAKLFPGSGTCPRAVVVRYEIKRSFFDMYDRAETDDWLHEWYTEAKKLPDVNWSEEIYKGYGRHCMANGFRDLLEAGHCELPFASTAEWALKGKRESTIGEAKHRFKPYRGAKQQVADSYGDIHKDAEKTIREMGIPKGTKWRQEKTRKETDPYYRAMTQCSQEVKDFEDSVAKKYFPGKHRRRRQF